MYKITGEKLVSPSLVKQYIYCPVIPWIMSMYNIAEPLTDSMKLGRENHQDKRQALISSTKNNTITILDEIKQENKTHIIIEHKTYPTKSIHRYIEQIKTQAHIAKNKYKHLRKAVLKINNKQITIEITHTHLKDAERLIQKTKTTINNEKPPPPTTNPQHCQNCWYKKYCPYK